MPERIKCIRCDNRILPVTAKHQDGLCGPCWWTESEPQPCAQCGVMTPKGTLQHCGGLCHPCLLAKIAASVED